jgi:small subunit ribosomal protein S20
MHLGMARSRVKAARLAISSGDVEAATVAVNEASKWLDHAATKGSIHPNNAGRRKGRLMAQLARMVASPVAPVAEVEAPAAKPSRAKAAKKTEKAEKVEKPAKATKAAKATETEKKPRARAKKSE